MRLRRNRVRSSSLVPDTVDELMRHEPSPGWDGLWVLVALVAPPSDPVKVYGPFYSADEAREVANSAAMDDTTWHVCPLGSVTYGG